jgi:cation:H+ antiporter
VPTVVSGILATFAPALAGAATAGRNAPLAVPPRPDTPVAQVALQLVAMLLLIVVAAELFTNALEHLGDRLGISEGVTGSLFAAVGTALPETLVPLLALFAGSADTALNQDIGTGAILGAPLMLSTLSTFLMACSVLRQRGWRGRVCPERSGLVRDLDFFLAAFAVAAAAMFLPAGGRALRVAAGLALVLLYVLYIALTLRASQQLVTQGHATQAGSRMWLARLGVPLNLFTIALQLAGAVALLLLGAQGFIAGVGAAAHALGVSALLLSLLIIPVATELPEKVNSILWVRRGKDTLAIGNITGAMVFQGTLLPAIGIVSTPWQPQRAVLAGVVVTLVAALWTRACARRAGLPLWALMANGALYAGYLAVNLA